MIPGNVWTDWERGTSKRCPKSLKTACNIRQIWHLANLSWKRRRKRERIFRDKSKQHRMTSLRRFSRFKHIGSKFRLKDKRYRSVNKPSKRRTIGYLNWRRRHKNWKSSSSFSTTKSKNSRRILDPVKYKFRSSMNRRIRWDLNLNISIE